MIRFCRCEHHVKIFSVPRQAVSTGRKKHTHTHTLKSWLKYLSYKQICLCVHESKIIPNGFLRMLFGLCADLILLMLLNQ